MKSRNVVIPAKAGIQALNLFLKRKFTTWIPAFAGMTALAFLLRVALGALFIYASYYKIVSPGAFAHQIYNYKFLPVWAINPLAIVLPWVQLFCGVALVINKGTRGASLLIVLMLFVFQLALASALWRGLNVSCGCFKSGGSPATWWTFVRDTLLLALVCLQFWISLCRKSNCSSAT